MLDLETGLCSSFLSRLTIPHKGTTWRISDFERFEPVACPYNPDRQVDRRYMLGIWSDKFSPWQKRRSRQIRFDEVTFFMTLISPTRIFTVALCSLPHACLKHPIMHSAFVIADPSATWEGITEQMGAELTQLHRGIIIDDEFVVAGLYHYSCDSQEGGFPTSTLGVSAFFPCKNCYTTQIQLGNVKTPTKPRFTVSSSSLLRLMIKLSLI
jgi:hypothetical protein